MFRFAPLVRAARTEGFTIASLNYDNCIELAAEAENTHADLEVGDWFHDAEGEPADESRAIRLLKLHGSIDWQLMKLDGGLGGRLHCERIHRMTREEMNQGIRDPALIFGGRNKMTASGPFLDLLIEFRERLFEAKELVAIGYSFGDQHINDLIEKWFSSNLDSKVTMVCGENFSPRQDSLGRRLLTLGSDRVLNLKKYAREGIESLFTAAE